MGKPTLTVSTDLEQSHFDCIQIIGGSGTDSMRIEVGVAEEPWCDRVVLHHACVRSNWRCNKFAIRNGCCTRIGMSLENT